MDQWKIMVRLFLTSFIFSVSFLVVGCGGSDTELKSVVFDSGHTCGEINALNDKKDVLIAEGLNEQSLVKEVYGVYITPEQYLAASQVNKKLSRTIFSNLKELDGEFTGDSKVERYYRRYLRGKLSYLVGGKVIAFCRERDDSTDLGQIMVSAINASYIDAVSNKRTITCEDLGQRFSFDQLLKEAESVYQIRDLKYIDRAALEKEVNISCQSDKDQIAFDVVYSNTKEFVMNLYKEWEEESKRVALEEANKAREKSLAKFSKSMIEDGILDCEGFKEQHELANPVQPRWGAQVKTVNDDDVMVYQSGLRKSLSDILSHVSLTPQKMKIFMSLMESDERFIPELVFSVCRDASGNGKDVTYNLINMSVEALPDIAYAKSDVAKVMDERYKKAESECMNKQMCRYDVEFLALEYAKEATRDCGVENDNSLAELTLVGVKDKYRPSHAKSFSIPLVCFNNADEFISHYKNVARYVLDRSRIKELTEEMKASRKSARYSDEVEKCQAEFVKSSINPESEFDAYTKSVCIPKAEYNVNNSYKKEISVIEDEINGLGFSIEGL